MTMGVQHGMSVSSNCERLRDALIHHVTSGCCALLENGHREGCTALLEHYSQDGDGGDSLRLQTVILTDIQPRIPLRPLQRLLRLLSLTFNPDMSLNRHRRVLKMFIDRLCPHVAARSIDPLVLPSQSDWPQVILEEEKLALLHMFNEETSSNNLHEFVCASCNSRTCVREHTVVPIEQIDVNLLQRLDCRYIDGRVLDDLWLDTTCVLPSLPVFEGCLKDVLVSPTGLLFRGDIPHALQLCKSCHCALRRGHTPDLALPNHIYIGDVPDELRDLSVVEESLIARCRAKSCIIQLWESIEGLVANAQRAMRAYHHFSATA